MEIKEYKAPRAEVIEVNVQGVLCQSGEYGVTGNDPITEPEE